MTHPAGNYRQSLSQRFGEFRKRGIQTRKFTYPRVIHPMVFTQAETGRKVLNVSPAFALGIYEMGGSDGDQLLREVVALCTEPAYAYLIAFRPDGTDELCDPGDEDTPPLRKQQPLYPPPPRATSGTA